MGGSIVKALKGQWVNTHKIILTEDERAPQVPDDTKKVPMEMWVKGFLLNEEASIGDLVEIKTLSGRLESGKLIEINPAYRHSFGEFVPEILQIGKELREILFGGDNDGK